MKKTTRITLAALLVACSQTLANFSGGDDFNDNSMDAGKWGIHHQDSGTAINEVNGRFEFSSPAGPYSDRSSAWEWISNGGSYTQDWTIVYDTVSLIDTNAIVDNELWFGMAVRFGDTFDDIFGIERDIENYGGFPRDIIGSDASVNDVTVVDTSYAASNSAITLKITFDASKKLLKGWFDHGTGFIPLSSFDVSAWGMTATDEFSLLLYGGNRGLDVAPGELYSDNLRLLPYIGPFPPNEEAKVYCPPNTLVGSWVMGDSTTFDSVMLTFLANGTFFLSHDGVAGDGRGMERGTYTWNTNTGIFVANVTVDTNNDAGLSDPIGTVTVTVDGDTLYYSPALEGTFPFQRVSYPSTPPSIIGGWVHLDTINNHDNVVFTFLPNGIYFFAQDGDSSYDPGGQDGMERGVYSWNADTGVFSATALVDTCGAWGPDGITSASVDGNTLTLNGVFDLHRVIDPLCSDLDGDGLPDVWEQQYFSNPTNATAGGHGDGDTLDNRAEYIAGTIPTSGSSVFEVSNSDPSPSGFVLNWNAIEGRVYTVEWTEHLTNGFQSLEPDIAYPQNSYTDTVHAAEDGGFYNLNVQLEN